MAVTKTSKTTGWCSNTLQTNCLYKYPVCRHIRCDTWMWSVIWCFTPYLNSGCSSLGYKPWWRPITCCSHLTTCKTEWHQVVYIPRKRTANISKRRKITNNSTKRAFLTLIFWNLNSSVAADGRPYCHLKSPTLDPNGKKFYLSSIVENDLPVWPIKVKQDTVRKSVWKQNVVFLKTEHISRRKNMVQEQGVWVTERLLLLPSS